MKPAKRILSIMMVVITLISIVSVSAEAVSVKVSDKNYGYMVPLNNKGTDIVSKVKLYGKYDYLNFFIHSNSKTETYFFYEAYSDKKMTKSVDSGYTVCDKGDYNWSPKITLKGKYKTKTYYVVTYAAKISSDGEKITVDKNSMRQFTLEVNRTTSFSKQMVILKETKNTTKGAYIKWSKLSGANKYYIYRRNITGSKWTKVGTVSKSKTSFTDASVKNKNGNYIYTVKAVNKKGTASRYHYAGLVCLFAKAPVLESASVIYNNYIEIEWGKTSGKAKYNIMRKEGNGSWKTIKKNYSETSYTDKTAKSGKKYTYSVKAVISTDYGKAISSYFANDSKAITLLGAPKLNDVALTEAGVKVTWKSVSGVSGYTVMRRPLNKSEGWTILGAVDAEALEFTDTTADLESAYIYTVRSEGESGKGSYYSAGKEFVVLDEPKDVRYLYASNIEGIEVRWQGVSYADQYNVYVMNEDGQWQLQKKIENADSGGYYTSFVPERYGEIKYTVTALRDGTNETPLGKTVYEMVFYPQVDITVAEIRKNGNLLRWKDKGAEKFNIYRSIGEEAEYELIETIEVTTAGEALSFTDADVGTGTYKYQVKGVYNGVEQTKFFGSKKLSRISDENIVRDEKVVFYRNRDARAINFEVNTGDYEKVYYAYNYKKDIWERISSNDIYDKASMSNEDGEYTVSVVYTVDGAKTPVDSVTHTGSFYDYSFDKITVKSVKGAIRAEWNEVDGAVKYIVRYSLPGTDEITETAEVAVNSKGKYSFEFERKQKERNFVDFVVEAVDAEGRVTAITRHVSAEPTPVMRGAVRKSDGEVWVYWNYYWQGEKYIVMRKTEGGSWKKIAKNHSCVHSKKYNGKKCAYFVDKTAEKGVEYTYTVIARGDEPMGDYIYINSYYDTVGITCKG